MMYVDEVFHDGGKAKRVLVAEQYRLHFFWVYDQIVNLFLHSKPKECDLGYTACLWIGLFCAIFLYNCGNPVPSFILKDRAN